MDNSKLNSILDALKPLLSYVYTQLKKLYSTVCNYISSQKVDLHKPSDEQKTTIFNSRPFLFASLAILILLMLNTFSTMQQDEISYNQFLKAVKEDKIAKAVVTDRYISGFFKDEKTRQ